MTTTKRFIVASAVGSILAASLFVAPVTAEAASHARHVAAGHHKAKHAPKPVSGLICPAFAHVVNGVVVQVTTCDPPAWVR